MKRQYVGHRLLDGVLEHFVARKTPTLETHGHLYTAVIGPFRTRRGADYVAKSLKAYVRQHVRDAERLALAEAIRLRMHTHKPQPLIPAPRFDQVYQDAVESMANA